MITVSFNEISSKTNIGLGNHLFQYALCRLIAEKNGYNFYIPHNNYIVKCFKDVDLGIKDGEIIYNYIETQNQQYDEQIFDIPDFTNLQGFFQTEKYFSGVESTIKKWFKVESSTEVDKILQKYPTEDYCYIHVRGGDYIINNTQLDKDYYSRAMEMVRIKNKNIKFVIITDDINFSYSLFPDVDILANDVITDFKCLYFSKYMILSNSSFSWWAAWLTDKVISIAPNKWLNYNQPHMGWHPIDVKSEKFIFI